MLNQLVVSAIVSSAIELRYSQDVNYAIQEFRVDIAPTPGSGEDAAYTTVKATSVAGKESDRALMIQSLKMDDTILIEGSLEINKIEGADGMNKYIPAISISNVTVLARCPEVPQPNGTEDAFNINRFIVTGRPGGDPEIKYFESGSVVANLSLAVDRPAKDKTDWVPVTMWGGTAETAANYVKKGSLIGLVGQLKFEHWMDRVTGQPRMKAVLNTGKFMGAQALRLMGNSQRDNGAGDDSYTQQSNGGGNNTGASTRGRTTRNAVANQSPELGTPSASAAPSPAGAGVGAVSTSVGNSNIDFDDIPF
jgi:single-strand DNA-binding protein